MGQFLLNPLVKIIYISSFPNKQEPIRNHIKIRGNNKKIMGFHGRKIATKTAQGLCPADSHFDANQDLRDRLWIRAEQTMEQLEHAQVGRA